MPEVSGKRAWAAVAGAAMIALTMTAAAAEPAPHSLKAVIDAVAEKGPDNQLPAHLSLVLGINKGEQPTPVKQAMLRDGSTVRTFNVRSSNHDDVVMMVYNDQSRSMKAYLVSPGGKLLKAVAYEAGASAAQRSAAEARGDFANEIKFWTESAHLTGPAR